MQTRRPIFIEVPQLDSEAFLDTPSVAYLTVNNKLCKFLIDGGSSASLLHVSFVNSAEIDVSKLYVLIGVTGHQVNALGSSVVTMGTEDNTSISAYTFVICDKTVPLTTDGILGRDWLRDNYADVLYSRDMLFVWNQYIPLYINDEIKREWMEAPAEKIEPLNSKAELSMIQAKDPDRIETAIDVEVLTEQHGYCSGTDEEDQLYYRNFRQREKDLVARGKPPEIAPIRDTPQLFSCHSHLSEPLEDKYVREVNVPLDRSSEPLNSVSVSVPCEKKFW